MVMNQGISGRTRSKKKLISEATNVKKTKPRPTNKNREPEIIVVRSSSSESGNGDSDGASEGEIKLLYHNEGGREDEKIENFKKKRNVKEEEEEDEEEDDEVRLVFDGHVDDYVGGRKDEKIENYRKKKNVEEEDDGVKLLFYGYVGGRKDEKIKKYRKKKNVKEEEEEDEEEDDEEKIEFLGYEGRPKHENIDNYRKKRNVEEDEGSEDEKIVNFRKKKNVEEEDEETDNENDSENSESGRLHRFPMNRISRIIKSEDSNVRIGQEAIFLINKASEKFLELFSREAYVRALLDHKTYIGYNHLSSVVAKRSRFDFLSDFVPEKVKAEDALAKLSMVDKEPTKE